MGRFFGSIPWWVYVIVMVVGLALTILFALLFARAKRRPAAAPTVPGGPPVRTGGTGFLVGAIVSLLLLLITPLVIMLVAQPWNRSSSYSRASDRSYDDEDRDRSDRRDRRDRDTDRDRSVVDDSDDVSWVEGRWSDDPNCRNRVIEFNSGGTGTARDDDRTEQMSWRQTGTGVTATVDNDSVVVSRDGSDAINLVADGESLRFERCS